MNLQMEELLKRITNFMQNEAKTETVIGKSFKLGEFTCIPVIRVGMGFGTGAGEGDDVKKGHGEGGAAGAGMGVEPIGFLVTKGEEIQFIGTKQHKGLALAFEKAPDLIEKYFEAKRAEKEPVMAN